MIKMKEVETIVRCKHCDHQFGQTMHIPVELKKDQKDKLDIVNCLVCNKFIKISYDRLNNRVLYEKSN